MTDRTDLYRKISNAMSSLREATQFALLCDVAENPTVDFYRLKFAEFLEDEGERDWPELIALQIEMHKVGEPEILTFNPMATTEQERNHLICRQCRKLPGLDLCKWHQLRQREQELLKAVEPFLEGAIKFDNCGTWERGFISSLRYQTGSRLSQMTMQGFCLLHPIHTIRLLDWSGIEASLPPLEMVPFLRRLELPSSSADIGRIGRAFTILGKYPGIEIEFWNQYPG